MLLEGAFWENGNWESTAILAGVLIGAYLLVMWCAALYWTYRDAASRSQDPVTQGLAVGSVLLFNLPGLLLYLILRPKATISERYEHRLEAEALLHEIQDQPSCPQCRRKIETEFLACPYCRIALRTACEECGKALAFAWVVCPYCGTDRAQPQHAQRAQPAAAPETNVTPMAKPARPKRASTATYTPPASKPLPETAPSAEPVTEI
jgi:hypothetical protein